MILDHMVQRGGYKTKVCARKQKEGMNSNGSSKMGIRGMSRSYPDSLTKGILSRGRSREEGTGHILHRLAGNREIGTGGSRWEMAPLSLHCKEKV